ncbi:MAG: Hsp20/alpha crystallin family protein [Pirellulales bacterium]|nr:Hsp20/alpha crystallin family protein [Pirellulales bacterium]
MTLIPWRNKFTSGGDISPLGDLGKEMDRMFASLVRNPLENALGTFGMAFPPLDVMESDDEVTVRVEVPGIDPQQLEITATGESLTIAGEKQEQLTEKSDKYFHHVETRAGRFRRTIGLPSGVDSQDVTADYQHGVLTVRLKKKQSPQAVKVQINAG